MKIVSKVDKHDIKTILEENPVSISFDDVAIVEIVPSMPVFVERLDACPTLGRFVIRVGNKMIGCGRILEIKWL